MTWLNKLHKNFDVPQTRNTLLSHDSRKRHSLYIILAHDVEYECEGFLDKNKDTVPDEQMDLLGASQFCFLKDVLQFTSSEAATAAAAVCFLETMHIIYNPLTHFIHSRAHPKDRRVAVVFCESRRLALYSR